MTWVSKEHPQEGVRDKPGPGRFLKAYPCHLDSPGRWHHAFSAPMIPEGIVVIVGPLVSLLGFSLITAGPLSPAPKQRRCSFHRDPERPRSRPDPSDHQATWPGDEPQGSDPGYTRVGGGGGLSVRHCGCHQKRGKGKATVRTEILSQQSYFGCNLKMKVIWVCPGTCLSQ